MPGGYGRPPVGLLNERIVVNAPTPTTDAQGGQAIRWTAQCTVWAKVDPYTSRRPEELVAGGEGSNVWYRITIRRRTDLLPKMTIAWRGLTLQIEGIFNDYESRLWTYLDCVSLT